MRRVFYALVIAAFVCSPVFGASSTEMARMGTFISNFTELGMYDIDIDTITSEELVHFGVWHNYINNRNSRVKRCSKKKCPYGELVIDKKYVAESVRKYFDVVLEHASTEDEHYDGKVYHFAAADGVPDYADVQEVSRNGNVITMRGEVYSSGVGEEKVASFIARAKPYKFKGKNTWAILSLKTQWYNR